MPFGYYVIFGNPKKPGRPAEESKKAWSDFKEAVEKGGLKFKFFGGAVGSSKESMCLLKGKVADYEAMLTTEAWRKLPLTDTQTVLVFQPPWSVE